VPKWIERLKTILEVN